MAQPNLSEQVRRILLKDWDPIKIQDEPCAQDEYDSYIQPICDKLQGEDPVGSIADYLTYVRTELMYPGFKPIPGAVEKQSREVAEKISKLE